MTIHVWGGLGGFDLLEVLQASWALHVALHGAFSFACFAAWGVGGASLCAHLGLLFLVVVCVWVTCFTCGNRAQLACHTSAKSGPPKTPHT